MEGGFFNTLFASLLLFSWKQGLMMAVGGITRGIYYTATGDFGHRAWGDPAAVIVLALVVTLFIGVPADLIAHYRSRRSQE